jgi:hypothetical protein
MRDGHKPDRLSGFDRLHTPSSEAFAETPLRSFAIFKATDPAHNTHLVVPVLEILNQGIDNPVQHVERISSPEALTAPPLSHLMGIIPFREYGRHLCSHLGFLSM